ncbi:MAG: radical SAM protein [Candidatus Zixiibacteriota bacterium]|nr:MAG: radical SAM protein [candidate division Zixibacteria bacterium]
MMHQEERKPYVVGWEITDQCNLTCPHCYSAAARRPHDEMTTDECKKIIDDMAVIGVSIIGWTGGEPLLRDDLEELIEYARSVGIRANITTNAVLLDLKRATSLLQAGNRAVQISLDGSTPEINRRMRRATEEEFYRIIEAIRICKKLNTRVYLASLVGQENLDDGPEMIKLASRENVNSIRFCGYTPIGRGKRNDIQNRLCFSERLNDLLHFVEAAQANGSIITAFDTGFGPVPPEYSFHKCIAGVETFYLKANGDVYPCTALLHRRFRVGNLRERPLKKIWDSREMYAMSVFPRDEIHGPCAACDNFANCRGACRGAAFAHTGDLRASFPVCLYRVALKANAVR